MKCKYIGCDLNNGDELCKAKLSPNSCGSRAVVDNGPIFLKIQEIIHEKNDIPIREIKEDSKLSLDLGMDSLDIVEAILYAEDFWEISISEEEQNNLTIVKDIVNSVSSKLKN